MFLFRRLIPLLVFFITFLALSSFLRFPGALFYLITATISLFLFLIYIFARKNILENFYFFLTPVLLFMGSIFFIIFLEDSVIKSFLPLFISLIIAFYFENLFVFFYRTHKYQLNSLELLSEYLNLLSAFFFFAGFFSLKLFLNFSLAQLALGTLLVSFCLLYQLLWVHKVTLAQNLIYSGLGALLLAEGFLVLSFLPNGYYVSAIGLSIFYYLFSNLALIFLHGHWYPRNIAKFVIISFSAMFLVYFTASWI